MTVHLDAFLRREDDVFESIEDVASLENPVPRLADGAVRLTIDGSELLGFNTWDTLLDVVGLLIGAVDRFVLTGTGATFLPSQPVRIWIESLSAERVLISVGAGDRFRMARADRSGFVNAVTEFLEGFVSRWRELDPTSAPTVAHLLDTCRGWHGD